MLSPKCPKAMPTKSIHVIPRETPKILILPSVIPIEITNANTNIECAIPVQKTNSFNQSMCLNSCHKSLLYNVNILKCVSKMIYKSKTLNGERKIKQCISLILCAQNSTPVILLF